MAGLASLVVADPPELWRDLGFLVGEDGACDVGGVVHRLGAPGAGVTAWSLRGLADLAELPAADPSTDSVPQGDGADSGGEAHPNGVTALDHLVVSTPDLARTIGALEDGGLRLRRTRDAESGEGPIRQAFFKLGAVVIEVVGPNGGEPQADRSGPARFWGLAFTVADLDATGGVLGDRLAPAREAVQAGRRIATLRRSAGSSVPIAFMTPAPRPVVA